MEQNLMLMCSVRYSDVPPILVLIGTFLVKYVYNNNNASCPGVPYQLLTHLRLPYCRIVGVLIFLTLLSKSVSF